MTTTLSEGTNNNGGARVRDIMTDVLTIDADGDLRLAVQIMLWGGFRQIPVLDRGKLVGIVTEHDINRAQARRGVGSTPVAEIMTSDVATAHPDDLVTEVARRLAEARVGGAPVVENGRVVGIVTSNDVLTHVGRSFPKSSPQVLLVRDVMTRTPRLIKTTQTLADAISEMVSAEVRHLPVLDEEGRVVGMLSDRDVRGLVGDPVAVLRDESFGETLRLTVDEVMTAHPITAGPDQPLEALAWALLDERIGAVPVVDEGHHLVGIVSYIDVLHCALRGR